MKNTVCLTNKGKTVYTECTQSGWVVVVSIRYSSLSENQREGEECIVNGGGAGR